MMAVRADDVRTLTLNEMKAFNLVREDACYIEWMLAKRTNRQRTTKNPFDQFDNNVSVPPAQIPEG